MRAKVPIVATLSSSSTLSEVRAAYFDNASYAEDSSTQKALAFCTACKFLMLYLAKHAGRGGEELDIDVQLIREEKRDAERWLARQSGTGGTGQTKQIGFASDWRG